MLKNSKMKDKVTTIQNFIINNPKINSAESERFREDKIKYQFRAKSGLSSFFK